MELKMSQSPLPKQDKIVENVLEKYRQRSQLGIKKYNTTLEENDKDDYLLHLQQELMDASLYIEKLMSKSCTKSSQTEISDGEIEKRADEYFKEHIDDMGFYGFIEGAKWYREQLKSRQ